MLANKGLLGIALCRVAQATWLLWRCTPIEVSTLVLLLLVQGAVPAVAIYISKLTIDGLVSGEQTRVVALVLVWILGQVLGVLFGTLSQILQGNVAERFTAYINLQLMQKAEEIRGLDLLEQKGFHDDVKTLQEGAKSRPLNLVVNMVFTFRELVTVLALLVLLAPYALWMPLLLLVGTVPLARATLHLREVGWRALVSRSENARALEYYSRLALGIDHAQEVRLYNLFGWLRKRYGERFEESHRLMRKVRSMEMSRTVLPMLVSLAAVGVVFAWAVNTSIAGVLTVGSVALVVQSIIQMQTSIQGFIESLGYLFERSLFFDHYFRFLRASSKVNNPAHPLPVPYRPSIVFEKVSFAYPDGRKVLHDVSFHIRYGETVALVGENGAGKSTLVKLLLRFYDPLEGRILVGGSDLRELRVEEWRSRVGAIFQTYGRYAFSVAQNIGIGDPERPLTQEALEAAASNAGLGPVIDRLPSGYDTLLGKEFGGTDLSGGEWQKLAIARALFRKADLLILDEPSAALDPRSEHEMFQSFAAISKGRTTLLITHRLASVQMADRILVLREGRLVEEGSHQALLHRNGLYAELWRLQAEGYRAN